MTRQQPDTIFHNGRVYTLDPRRKRVEAILVSGGRIESFGSDSQVMRTVSRGCEKVDLKGMAVLPSFTDCHTHFLQMGIDAMYVDLSGARSLSQALAMLGRAADSVQEGEWVIGVGWMESAWPDGQFVSGKDLDACCPLNPTVAHRICGHLSAVNSRAISELGLDGRTPGVDVDSSGSPTGIIRERAVGLARQATAPTRAQKMKALNLATRSAHSKGVTSIHDNGESEDFSVYGEAERSGRLRMRVWFNAPSQTLDAAVKLGIRTGHGSDWLKFGGLKVFCDGALGARTAAISRPYSDDPGNRGMFVHKRRELDRIVSLANASGIQLAVHAIGDRGIDIALSAIGSALKSFPRKDARHRIEHLELPTRGHIETMRRLGIVASMQPNFVGEWGGTEGMYVSRLGKTRTARNNPFREVLDAGVRLVFGSDCMPFSPFYGIRSAVNAAFPSQRITKAEAITAYTRSGAYASFEENCKGTLSPGKLADFVTLSSDPFLDGKGYSDIKIMRTVVSGEVVFRRRV